MSCDVKVRIGAEISELASGISNAVEHVKKMGTAVEATAGDTRKLDDALTRYMSRLDPAYRSQVLLAQGVDLLDENLKAGNISAQTHAEMLAKVEAAYGVATAGAQKNGAAVAGVGKAHGMEIWRIQAFTHSIRASVDQMLAGQNPANVLAMQISQLAMTTTGTSFKLFGLAAAALAVVGGLALAIARAEGGRREMNTLEVAFQATGRAGLFNADAMREVIRQLSQLPGVSRSAAVEIVTEFARTRQVGGAMFASLASIVADFARATGTEAPEAARTLAHAFAEPAAGARKLDQELGFLSANQLLAIERFTRLGDRVAAQQVLFDALKGWVQGLTRDGITPLEASLTSLANAWGRLMAAMGKGSGIDNTLDAIVRTVNTWAAVFGNVEAKIALLDEELAAVQRTKERATGLVLERVLAREAEIRAELETLRAELDNASKPGSGRGASGSWGPEEKGASGAPAGADVSAQGKIKSALALGEKWKTVEWERAEIQKEINRFKEAEALATGEAKAKLQDQIKAAEQARDALKGKGDASRLEAMRQELEQLKAQEDGFLDFSKRKELEFWEGKLSTLRKGSADYAQVHREVYTLRRAVAKEDFDREIADLKVQMEAKRKDGEERVRLAQEIARRTGEAYGQESVQYKQALREVEAAQREHAEQMRQLKELELEAVREHEQTQLDLRRQNLAFQREMGEITAREEVQGLRELEQQQYAMELKALQDKLQIQGQEVLERRRILNQIETLQRQHQVKMDQLRKKEVTDERARWMGIMQPATSAMASATTAVLTRAQTWRQGMASVGQAILSQMVGTIYQIVQKWTAGLLTKLAVTETTAAAETAATTTAATTGSAAVVAGATTNISAKAAEGAAAAGASVAHWPYWGWAAAAGVAAATFGMIAAFKGRMASAAGGWDQVPEDQVTQLHKDEMVLSAPIAGMFRNLAAMAKGSLGFSVPKVGGGWEVPAEVASMARASEIERSQSTGAVQDQCSQDTHVHAHFTINALDAKGVDRVLKRNRGSLLRVLKNARRDGATESGA